MSFDAGGFVFDLINYTQQSRHRVDRTNPLNLRHADGNESEVQSHPDGVGREINELIATHCKV